MSNSVNGERLVELTVGGPESDLPGRCIGNEGDPDLFLAAVQQSGQSRTAPTGLKMEDRTVVLESREIVLETVKKDGLALKHASADLQADREIVLAAVRSNGLALGYANPDLQADREVVLAAVRNNGLALHHATAALLHCDPEIVLAAVTNNGLVLECADYSLRGNSEIVLAAVTNNGLALEYASPDLRKNDAVMLEAVKNNGLALNYASLRTSRLKANPVIAASRDRVVRDVVNECYRIDVEIVLAAVKNNGLALQYVDLEFRRNREIALEAVSQNWGALDYVSPLIRGVIEQEIIKRRETAFSAYRVGAHSESKGHSSHLLDQRIATMTGVFSKQS